MSISILVVDDDPMVLVGLRMLSDAEPDVHGAGGSGAVAHVWHGMVEPPLGIEATREVTS